MGWPVAAGGAGKKGILELPMCPLYHDFSLGMVCCGEMV